MPRFAAILNEKSCKAFPYQGNETRIIVLAEKEALRMLERGLPLVIVNPSTPIGPHDIKPTPIGKIIVDFLNGRMPAYIDTGLNIVHVRDVAKGHLLAAQAAQLYPLLFDQRHKLRAQKGL